MQIQVHIYWHSLCMQGVNCPLLDTVATTGEWLWTSVLFLRMKDGKGTQGEKQWWGTSVTISSHHTLILGWPQMSSRWLDGLRCSKTGGDLAAGMGGPAAWPLGEKMARELWDNRDAMEQNQKLPKPRVPLLFLHKLHSTLMSPGTPHQLFVLRR